MGWDLVWVGVAQSRTPYRPPAEVASELNDRLRQNLAWNTPAALLEHHIAELPTAWPRQEIDRT